MKRATAIVLALGMGGLLACGRSEPPPPTPAPVAATTTTLPAPVSVATVVLGKEIGADKRVIAPLEAFGAKDTIYATVETTGTGRAKLRALWTFVKGEKTSKVDETTIELDAAGPAVSEFHVSKPSGWPKGDYRVEIFLGDATAPAVTKSFKVG